jgi:ubiquinone/menaquinone biosynthesis C-methylase UbiE
MSNSSYHPESYWTEVGSRIKARENGKNVIAGDDEPYYRYKRKKFLELLNEVHFEGKRVLEVGCGPGGNLAEIVKAKPKRLVGVDISAQMVELSAEKLGEGAEVIKINGTSIPFGDRTFDIVFTATVLQHNTDEEMLRQIMGEICRVSSDRVYLFERIENEIKGDALCLGRPVDYYSGIMATHGFQLASTRFINIRSSYYVSGAIRKLLNPANRQEGEPLNGISVALQKLTLPITRQVDKLHRSDKDICRLEYTQR